MGTTADIVGVAHEILKLFEGEESVGEPWARDENMFQEHFGVPYEEFAARIPMLSADQSVRYTATLKVNPEAAVLWVISMDNV